MASRPRHTNDWHIGRDGRPFDADDIDIQDLGGLITATDVEGALAELAALIAGIGGGPIAAADVTYDPAPTASNVYPQSATNVQDAIDDVVADLDDLSAAIGSGGTTIFLPLTTVVAGEPQLVWDGDDSLVLTEIARPT